MQRTAKVTALLMLCVSITLSLPLKAALTFNFNYTDSAGVGFNAAEPLGGQRRAALQETAVLIANMFPSYTATININVNGNITTDGVLASAGSNFNSNDAQTCAQGFNRGDVGLIALGGQDPAPGSPDGTISVNFEDHVWGLGDSVPANEMDFKSTMLHEILHAMGFSHSITNTGSDPCSTTAPNPGSWIAYDQHLGNSGGLFINPSFVIDTNAWTTSIIGGAGTAGVLWRGAGAVSANNGNPVPLYSPNPIANGSSISHLDDDFYTNEAYLMEAATGPGPGTRTLSNIEKGIMNDIGFLTSEPNKATLFNLPFFNNGDKPFIRITNNSDKAATITGTLYTENGVIVGSAKTQLTSGLDPQKTFVINDTKFEELFNTSSLSGRGRMLIESDQSRILVQGLIRTAGNVLTNVSEVSRDGNLLNVPSATSNDKYFVRVTNTSDAVVQVTGSLRDKNAGLLGIENSVVFASIPVGGTSVISHTALATSLSAGAWNDRVQLQLEPADKIVVMGLNRSNGVLVNMSAVNQDNRVGYIPNVNSAETVNIRFFNRSASSISLSGKLYNDSGLLLGSGVLSNSLASKAMIDFDATTLSTQLNINTPWSGVAHLEVTSSGLSPKIMVTLVSGGVLTNLSTSGQNLSIPNVAPSTHADESIIRITNHSSSTAAVIKGTLYDNNGLQIGATDTIISNSLAANAVLTLSGQDLQNIFNQGNAFFGRGRLVLNNSTPNVSIQGLMKVNVNTIANLSRAASSE